MGVLRREYEREMARRKKPDDAPKVIYKSRGISPLVLFGLVIVAVFLLPLLQAGFPVFQVYAPNPVARVTELEYQQSQLLSSIAQSTAAAEEQARAYQAATQQQQALLSTSVAQVTSTQAAQATSTAWAYTQTPLAAEQIERDLKTQKMLRDAYWAQFLSPLKVIGLGVLGFAVLVAVFIGTVWAFVQIVPVYVAKMRIVKEERGERTIHLGNNSITRPDLFHAPVVTFQPDGTAIGSGGAANDLTQERIAANAAKVKAVQGYAPGVRLSKETLPELTQPNEAPQLVQTNNVFPLPSWDVFESWNGDQGIPFGVSANGIEIMNFGSHPHVGVLGKTGSGKSRRFLRPFLAGALAIGKQVVIIGKQADYWPFASHPNATIVPVRELTMEHEAERFVEILKCIVEEMNRRDGYLTSHRKSTWLTAGRESTLIVLDELGNAIDLMPRAQAELSYRYIRGLTKEGRKVGLNIVFASQRAKGFRDIMTQVGRAVFFVEDEQESRFALGALGAETLREGYFYSRFGGLKLTGAFEPTDDELARFLSARHVQQCAPVDWIDADRQVVAPVAPMLQEPDEIAELAERIRSQWEPGMSLSKTSQLLGKPYAGPSWIMKVKKVVEFLTSTSENIAPTGQNGGSNSK